MGCAGWLAGASGADCAVGAVNVAGGATATLAESFRGVRRCMLNRPTPITSVAAIAVRHGVTFHLRAGFAPNAGITPPGVTSSDDTIRDDAATSPRASATMALHAAQDAACACTRAASSAGNAPSSQA